MSFELLIFGGYGQFVWPAFIFTFASCFFLFARTNKEFRKLEKIYLKEFNQSQKIEIAAAKEKKALSAASL